MNSAPPEVPRNQLTKLRRVAFSVVDDCTSTYPHVPDFG
jgi:hypothetical protein